MWAKVLAGLMAAVSVTGVGVWVALPNGHCDSGCSAQPRSSRMEITPVVLKFDTPLNAPDADALAACTGGMAISTTAAAEPTKAAKPKCACCEE